MQHGLTSTHIALSTPHQDATAAALRLVEEHQGNAVDAALIAAIHLTVIYPHNCSVAGDLVSLLQQKDGSRTALNSTGFAGTNIDVKAISAESARQGISHLPLAGAAPITVPGAIAGWGWLHEQAGSMPWKLLFQPAIASARNGAIATESVVGGIEERLEDIRNNSAMAELYLRDGQPITVGTTIVQEQLAQTLETIAAQGPDAFYRGSVGQRYLAGMQQQPLFALTAEDLAAFKPQVVPELSVTTPRARYITLPPNTQGFIYLRLMAALDRLDITPTEQPELTSCLFYLAAQHRDELLADSAYMSISAESLVSPASIEEFVRQAQELLEQGGPGALPQPTPPPNGDTVAVVAAGPNGQGISLIQSLFHSFGSCVREPETGLISHNRGVGFSLDPQSENFIAAGKKPAHTLMPVLIDTFNQPENSADYAQVGASPSLGAVKSTNFVGTMGGRGQAQILAQISNNLVYGDDPQTAVSKPRWVVGSLEVREAENTINAEEGLVGEAAEQLQYSPGFAFKQLPPLSESVGHSQIVSWDTQTKELHAGTDPRADGLTVKSSPSH